MRRHIIARNDANRLVGRVFDFIEGESVLADLDRLFALQWTENQRRVSDVRVKAHGDFLIKDRIRRACRDARRAAEARDLAETLVERLGHEGEAQHAQENAACSQSDGAVRKFHSGASSGSSPAGGAACSSVIPGGRAGASCNGARVFLFGL